MELAMLVWAIGMLKDLHTLFVILVLVLLAFSGICIMNHNDYPNRGWLKHLKWTIPSVLLCWVTVVAIPSEKTAYLMVAAYATQQVAENPKVQDMSGKVLTIIDQKLDGYIEGGLKSAANRIK